ncbi:MAG: hypothetical protein HKO90_09440 [Flavobacteriaceae bacterium]|nr:hypothetical protein [Flavobacteriaceae bacterium]
MKANVLKYSVLLVLAVIMLGGLYYLNLPNRHKAIIKTKLRHGLGLVDNSWNVVYEDSQTAFITPTLVIDGIYKSMEGPKVMRAFQLDPSRADLVFITGFTTEALSPTEVDNLSDDYICHTNVDYYDGEHYSRWDLNHRIGMQYPRLTSMSHGIESYNLPKGYGFPVFTNENLFLSTQTLNHNVSEEVFGVKHKISLNYSEAVESLKPLYSKTIFIMLPYDKDNPFEGPSDENPNACLPVETKNHSYVNENGQALSGHWVIFPGEAEYSFDVTAQMQLQDSTSLHHAAIHVHPFTESLSLVDKTMNSILFESRAQNYRDKIGLEDVSYFSSSEGIMLYPDHRYELVLKVNNTTGIDQDMMASMFIFLYDKEMDEKLKAFHDK